MKEGKSTISGQYNLFLKPSSFSTLFFRFVLSIFLLFPQLFPFTIEFVSMFFTLTP